MTDAALTVDCPTAADTRRLGRRIGAACRNGLLITLSGGLGSGKTTLVQGLAAGLGVPAQYPVTSPTYTLVNEYPGRVDLAHADLYRLSDAASLEDIGLEELLTENVVVAVEWPEHLPPDALTQRLSIDIAVLEGDARRIRVQAYGLEPADLLEAVSEI